MQLGFCRVSERPHDPLQRTLSIVLRRETLYRYHQRITAACRRQSVGRVERRVCGCRIHVYYALGARRENGAGWGQENCRKLRPTPGDQVINLTVGPAISMA